MTTSYSWTLLSTPAAGGTGVPVVGGSPALPCPIEGLTQAELLLLVERIFPESYLDPLLEDGAEGYELLQAYAKIAERMATAVERLACAHLITSAEGGSFAEVSVSFSRDSYVAGEVTVKSGTLVTTSIGGRDFFLLEDVYFGPTDLGPVTGRVRAVAAAYEWNVAGETVTADGTTLPGAIDTVKRWVLDPPFGDTSLTVKNVAAATGGAPPALDSLGADRGITREPGESDARYRTRLRRLPETITPDAIQTTLRAVLDPLGAEFDFIETWDITYQTCWDAPHEATGDYDPNLFTYDDPRDTYPFRNRWLSEEDFRGGFIVVVPAIAALRDYGIADDDTAASPADYIPPSTSGLRAVSADDLDGTLIDSEVSGVDDGYDQPLRALYLGLYVLLQQIKAGGVTAALELKGAA